MSAGTNGAYTLHAPGAGATREVPCFLQLTGLESSSEPEEAPCSPVVPSRSRKPSRIPMQVKSLQSKCCSHRMAFGHSDTDEIILG